MAFEDPTRHPVQVGLDVVASGMIVGSFLQWLPAVAAVLSIVWFCIQIGESRTVQGLWARLRVWRKARKVLRLRALVDHYSGELTRQTP